MMLRNCSCVGKLWPTAGRRAPAVVVSTLPASTILQASGLGGRAGTGSRAVPARRQLRRRRLQPLAGWGLPVADCPGRRADDADIHRPNRFLQVAARGLSRRRMSEYSSLRPQSASRRSVHTGDSELEPSRRFRSSKLLLGHSP